MLWGQDLASGEENGARMRPVETGKVLGGVGGPWDRTWRGREDVGGVKGNTGGWRGGGTGRSPGLLRRGLGCFLEGREGWQKSGARR